MTRRMAFGLIAAILGSLISMPGLAADGDVRIALAGPGGKGSARFRNRGGVREFQVETENLRVPAGTILRVAVNGQLVGAMTVSPLHRARLNLSTQLGQAVPVIGAGSMVSVLAPNGAVLMSRRF
jgi:hypothetical protein